MQSLKSIIFDVDGTLANTEEIHRLAFNCAFTEFGLDFEWTPQLYTELLSISGGRERITAYLKAQNVDIKGDIKLRDFALRLHQRKSEIYREKLVAGHIGLRNGVLRLISEAHQQGIKLGIATASSYTNVETLLQTNLGPGALGNFDVIVTSDIIKDKKPSPVVYQFALAELGLTPDYCIAIEDTTNGNRAALAAGLKTIITTHEFTVDNDFSGASLVIDQLGEPDKPFNILSGHANNYSYVDVNLLKQLIESENQGTNKTWTENTAVLAK
jgi:HAD superfamily hydrolase (TIGR01509 family)